MPKAIKATVKRHWSDFKGYVRDLNTRYRKTAKESHKRLAADTERSLLGALITKLNKDVSIIKTVHSYY